MLIRAGAAAADAARTMVAPTASATAQDRRLDMIRL
jgi:hypothetical protein